MNAQRIADRIAADHPCLVGHFPGRPVVPAVVLLERVAVALSSVLGRQVRLSEIPSAKFLAPLLPETPFEIELNLQPDLPQARFRVLAQELELVVGRCGYVDVV